jgi:sugar-specific transcriptional regulator TrmB
MSREILLVNEDYVQTIVKLGLSISQAKIFLTLICMGAANAKQICQTVKMDNADVYRHLEALQKKGLVEKVLKFPYEYKAIALNESLKILMKEKDEEDRRIQRKAKALLKNLTMTPIQEKDFKLSIIPQKIAAKRFVTTEHKNMKEVYLYSQIETFPRWIFKFGRFWKEGIGRNNGQVHAIAELNNPADADNIVKYIKEYSQKNSFFNCRFTRSRLLITFGVQIFRVQKEKDEALFIYTESATAHEVKEILWTNNPLLLNAYKELFELKWKISEEL